LLRLDTGEENSVVQILQREIIDLAAGIFLAIALVLFPPNFAASQDSDTPEDFELTLFSAPIMKGALPGPHGVIIHRNNTATFFSVDPNGEKITGKNVEMDDGAVDALYRVVQEQDFFDLKPLYEDPRVMDGDYAVLTVTANGATHSVRTTNIKLKPFDTISLWVNSFFEPEDMIIYNAFIDGDMKDAER